MIYETNFIITQISTMTKLYSIDAIMHFCQDASNFMHDGKRQTLAHHLVEKSYTLLKCSYNICNFFRVTCKGEPCPNAPNSSLSSVTSYKWARESYSGPTMKNISKWSKYLAAVSMLINVHWDSSALLLACNVKVVQVQRQLSELTGSNMFSRT